MGNSEVEKLTMILTFLQNCFYCHHIVCLVFVDWKRKKVLTTIRLISKMVYSLHIIKRAHADDPHEHWDYVPISCSCKMKWLISPMFSDSQIKVHTVLFRMTGSTEGVRAKKEEANIPRTLPVPKPEQDALNRHGFCQLLGRPQYWQWWYKS